MKKMVAIQQCHQQSDIHEILPELLQDEVQKGNADQNKFAYLSDRIAVLGGNLNIWDSI
ncbi:MAG: hypothetical protein R2879_07730 [Saprospiraceae bacterium]